MPDPMPTPKTPPPLNTGNANVASVPSGRLTSVDAYRGLVMFLMMAEVLKLKDVAKSIKDSGLWSFLAHHQEHAEWVGGSLHDLIQPSFSFLVGVALPYSIAGRRAKGHSAWRMAGHAFVRAFILIVLGIFLRSTYTGETNYTFEDTLTQIGLGYGFLFLLGLRPRRDQWIALAVILVGFWLAFALYPLPAEDFNYKTVGVSANWLKNHGLSGFAAHWNKNCNLSSAVDTWFLNLFPRAKPFTVNGGGYVTLSFIPTLGTMLMGLIAGGWLRSERSSHNKLKWLFAVGWASIVVGWLLDWFGVCPLVKKIWTPSWTIFSGGWCCLLLASFYAVMDVWRWRAWAFPLVVIGMNSIAAYCMNWLFRGSIESSLSKHFSPKLFLLLGPEYRPLLFGGAVLLVLWLILFWMYRQKFFVRI